MRTDSAVRPHLYTIRLSPDEDERAKRIAAHFELPISTMLRTLLLEKSRELGLEPAKAKRTTKGGK